MNASIIQQVLLVYEEAERLQIYFSIYLYVMLGVCIIPTGIIFYFFRDHFTRLNAEFRPIILHATGISTILMITITLWQPVALSPLFGGYSVGPLKYLGKFI
jgi:ABC-type transport system involved in cytochrome bd biosynthesis fused ATPase/permease subunit